MPLPIDVVLTELELADEFLAAIRRRDIPEKFFYWFPLSVRAWLALCGEGAYRNFSRSRQVVQRHAARVPELVPAERVEVVSLGAGQGDKDRRILAALAHAGRRVRYRPVDASMGLLEIAVRDAQAEGHATRGVKADFTDASQLVRVREDASRDPDTTRLVLLLGNTLGGFDPARMARMLAGLMRDGDHAIVDGELFVGAETLAGYDNAINRRFAFAPLAAAGLSEDDGELAFAVEADADRAGVYRVIKHFTATRGGTMRVAGEALALRAGERFSMSPSHKYDEAGFFGVLRDAALEPMTTYRSDDERFLMTVVRRRAHEAA